MKMDSDRYKMVGPTPLPVKRFIIGLLLAIVAAKLMFISIDSEVYFWMASY
jgi:hypothetical protein